MACVRWLTTGLRARLPWAWLLVLLLRDAEAQMRWERIESILGFRPAGVLGATLVTTLEMLVVMAGVWILLSLYMTSVVSDLGLRTLLPKAPMEALLQQDPPPEEAQALRNGLQLLRLSRASVLGFVCGLSFGLGTAVLMVLPLVFAASVETYDSFAAPIAFCVTFGPVTVWFVRTVAAGCHLACYVRRQYGRPPAALLPAPLICMALWLSVTLPGAELFPHLPPTSTRGVFELGMQLLSVVTTALFLGCVKDRWKPCPADVWRRLWPSNTEAASSISNIAKHSCR